MSAPAAAPEAETLDAANRRKAAALADKHELAVQERRGELLAVDAVRLVYAETFHSVRRRIGALPDRLASELAGRPREEIRDTLRRELTAALTVLAADPFGEPEPPASAAA